MIAAATSSMNGADYRKVCDLVRRKYGINLTENKKVLLETRLRKRLAETGCRNYSEYTSYLFSKEKHREELVHLIDAISTNKTDFFREPGHFEYLVDRILPDWWSEHSCSPDRREPLRVWSAACSTGEEPYTIAMILADFALRQRGFTYSIVASDVSTRVLSHAEQAIYDLDQIEPVPKRLRNRYLHRGNGKFEGRARVIPDLRKMVQFQRVNLLEPSNQKPVYDVVFLRNVLIYFDRETKRRVVSEALGRLRPGGYLFVGHSETLFDMNLALDTVRPNVYRKSSVMGATA